MCEKLSVPSLLVSSCGRLALVRLESASLCQTGALAGLASISHRRETAIPSITGYPKPGSRVIENAGTSSGHQLNDGCVREWHRMQENGRKDQLI